MGVASNPNTPIDTLEYLCKNDFSMNMRSQLVTNPNVPQWILDELLSGDESDMQ